MAPNGNRIDYGPDTTMSKLTDQEREALRIAGVQERMDASPLDEVTKEAALQAAMHMAGTQQRDEFSEPQRKLKGPRPFGIPAVPKGMKATKKGRMKSRLATFYRKQNLRYM